MGKKVSILFFIVVFGIYLHNLTRDIYSGDIGDLVSAAYTGGVAHPPGYPLFTFLGFILSHLPLPLPIVSKVALVSMLASFAGVILFYLFCVRVTRNIVLSLISTATLAFSYYFWLHAEIPEVFGLNNFFVIALLYTSYLFYKTKKIKYFYITSLLGGLSLTHHHTILFLLPSLLILVFANMKIFLKKPVLLLKGIGLALVGFAVYVYVPLAASTNAPVSWDQANTLNNFLHLLLRRDYHTVGAGALPIAARPILMSNYIWAIVNTFSYQMILVIILGAVYLFQKDKRLLIALTIGVLLTGPLFVMYVGDVVTTSAQWGVIERFYVLSTVVLAFYIPFGLLFIYNLLQRYFSKKILALGLTLYFAVVPLFMVVYTFPRTDLSQTRIGTQYAQDILSNLPLQSVLFVSGDTTSFNLWYEQYAVHTRPDVDLINPSHVGSNIFLDKIINDYDQKHPHTPARDLYAKTFADLYAKRPIYSTFETISLPKEYILVPVGMVFQVTKLEKIADEQSYISLVQKNLKKAHLRSSASLSPAEQNLIAPEIPTLYSNKFVKVGEFLMNIYKDPARALNFYYYAMRLDDTNAAAYAGIGISQYKAYAHCRGGIDNLEKAISLAPFYKDYYRALYFMYGQCKTDQSKMNTLEKKYRQTFNKDLKDEVNKVSTTQSE